MKQNILLLALCASGFFTCSAQTNVGGTLTGNVIWDLSGSPYIVTSDVTVPNGSTLTIMPSVLVKFNDYLVIHIDGTIRAIGTADSMIEIKSNQFIPPQSPVYGGFCFSDLAVDYDFTTGTGSIFQFCKMQNAGGQTNSCIFPGYSAIISYMASPFIDNCIFEKCDGTFYGLDIRTDIHFTNNKIFRTTGNGFDLIRVDIGQPGKTAEVTCNLFKDNILNIGGYMTFTGGNTHFSNNIFVSNRFTNNFFSGSNLNFNDNAFYANSFLANSISVSDSVQHNTFAYNKAYLGTGGFFHIEDTMAVLNNNNFIGNYYDTLLGSPNIFMQNYILRQQYNSPHINATSNYWGTTNTNDINDLIFDYYDDTSYHHIDYLPILTSPDINAPVSPVQNVTRINLGGNNVQLNWTANPESDIAGYRIYWGGFTGYSFSNHIDVGNVTSYTLSGVANSDSIALTAYDANSTSFNDFCSGQEAWFSSPRLTAVGINENESSLFKINFSPNPFNNYSVTTITSSSKENNCSLFLFDATGRKVSEQNFHSSTFKLYRNKLTAGVYFYSINDKGKNILARGKLVIVD